MSWNSLDQLQNGDFVNIIGRVIDKPEMDPTSLIRKARVCVTNNEFIETIELLGEDANVFMKRGDTVLFHGLKVQEYRKERVLQTTFLSRVHANPPKKHCAAQRA